MNQCPMLNANPSQSAAVPSGGDVAGAIVVAVIVGGIAWWWMSRPAKPAPAPAPSTTKGVPQWLAQDGRPTPPHLRGLPAMSWHP